MSADPTDTVSALRVVDAATLAPAPLALSDAAVTAVVRLREHEEEENVALHVGVRPGGCSGFSYEMFFAPDRPADATVLVFEDPGGGAPLDVVVDAASLRLLAGATLDYRDSLTGGGFHVSNPNATRSCGCGQSFS